MGIMDSQSLGNFFIIVNRRYPKKQIELRLSKKTLNLKINQLSKFKFEKPN
jgi:hypothetical protein